MPTWKEEDGQENEPKESNPWIRTQKPNYSTSWKSCPDNASKLLVSFSSDGFVAAEVVIPASTPMREIEARAIAEMERIKL